MDNFSFENNPMGRTENFYSPFFFGNDNTYVKSLRVISHHNQDFGLQ